MSSIKFLNSLVAALPLLEVLAEMTSSKVGNWLVELGHRLKDDQDLIEELASWLALPPGFEAKRVPEQLRDLEVSLLGLRGALRRAS